ncbi:MAG: DNA-binding transcriptional regulator, FadR family, partial [Caulobacter sp.]|nr:DNA-binding transcriptional regulator, FadR family [Caulobacter sp.]
AAVLAFQNATDEELNALVEVLNVLDKAETNEQLAENLRAFLRLLAQASHNVLISTISNFLSDLLIELVQDELVGLGDRWKVVAAQLGPDRRLLAEALRGRDVARATILATDYHNHTKRLVAAGRAAGTKEADAVMRRAVKRVQAR